jgi:hypothetical protein
MKRIFFALSFLAMITTGLTVNAQDSTKAAKKQMKEQKRTDKTAARLEKKESKTEKEQKNPQPDGIVSGKDKTGTIREQNKANRDLRKEKQEVKKQ